MRPPGDDDDILEIEGEPFGVPPIAGPDPAPPKLIRNCPFELVKRGHWSFWIGPARWGFCTAPRRRLWRVGWEMKVPGWLDCLDDAVIYAQGYEDGLGQAGKEGT